MKFFDAHTHVQFAAYSSDRDEVLARALAADVGMVNVGTQKDTSRLAVDLARKHEGVYAAVGLHPIHTSKSHHDADELGGDTGFTSRGEEFDYGYYENLAAEPKVVAIGECGLDYFRLAGEIDEVKKRQKDAFVKQIELAYELKKPLMIHCREALSDLIEILEANRSKLKTDAPGIAHFFSGTTEEAKKLLEMGFYFTFGGTITFPPKAGAPDYHGLVELIPLDRILSETDAPYVAPVPYRGKRNEPLYVTEVVKKMAEIKDIPVDEMRAQILKNAEKCFNLKLIS